MLPKHRENASVALSRHHSPRPRAANGCETGSSRICIGLERKGGPLCRAGKADFAK